MTQLAVQTAVQPLSKKQIQTYAPLTMLPTTKVCGGTREASYNPPHTSGVHRRFEWKKLITCSGPRELNPFRDAPPPLAQAAAWRRTASQERLRGVRSMQVPCRFNAGSMQHFRPRWLQERSRCVQDAPRALQELSRCTQDASRGLKDAQDASKSAKMPSEYAPGPQKS